MLNLLLAFALVAQDVPFSASDVRAVTMAVLDDLIPPGGHMGARPVAGRPILFDAVGTSKVFQRLTRVALPTPIALPRRAIAMDRDHAVRCAETRDCVVVNDGLFVQITDAMFTPASGELRVHCNLAWSSFVYDRHQIDGFDMDIVFKRDGAAWKIVRRENVVTG